METRDTPYREVRLGPARLWLSPLEPWQWAPRREVSPGPASFCLDLLGTAPVRWRDVATVQGQRVEPDPDRLAALPAAYLDGLLTALQAPWLTPEEAADMALLARHLEHRADFPGVDCAACAQQDAAGEGPPDCAACPLPSLPAAGWEALRLWGLARRCPAEAASLLPALASGAAPRELRLLLMRWALIAARLERRSGPVEGAMLK